MVRGAHNLRIDQITANTNQSAGAILKESWRPHQTSPEREQCCRWQGLPSNLTPAGKEDCRALQSSSIPDEECLLLLSQPRACLPSRHAQSGCLGRRSEAGYRRRGYRSERCCPPEAPSVYIFVFPSSSTSIKLPSPAPGKARANSRKVREACLFGRLAIAARKSGSARAASSRRARAILRPRAGSHSPEPGAGYRREKGRLSLSYSAATPRRPHKRHFSTSRPRVILPRKVTSVMENMRWLYPETAAFPIGHGALSDSRPRTVPPRLPYE